MEQHTYLSLSHRSSELRFQAENSRKLRGHVIENKQFPKICFDLDNRDLADEITRHLFETWCRIEYPGLYKPSWDGSKYESLEHNAMFKGWLAGYEKGWYDATNILGGLEKAKQIQEVKSGR